MLQSPRCRCRRREVSDAKSPGRESATGTRCLALGGGTHNSLLVEFKEYVAVVDAPNNEERSLAVIAEAARLAPKPVNA